MIFSILNVLGSLQKGHYEWFYVVVGIILVALFTPAQSGKFLNTTHNWQNSKGVFLLCDCHEIYRVQAVGLKKFNYTEEFAIFVNM